MIFFSGLFFILRLIIILSYYNCLWLMAPFTVNNFMARLGQITLISITSPLVIIMTLLNPRLINQRGKRLNLALQKLGPIFIKFGQGLSLRPDVVGFDVARNLANLQDRLPPFAWSYVKKTLTKELGKPPSELFLSFNQKPKAAASISQVHQATIKIDSSRPNSSSNQQMVAVKILRPNIKFIFLRDVRHLKNFCKILQKFSTTARALNLFALVETFETITAQELDLRLEAAAADELRENFIQQKNFYVPKIHWQYVSEKIITLDWVDGINITNEKGMATLPIPQQELLQQSAEIFFLQIFRDGFFHADLHPGNLFFMPDGKIAVVDFGIMGRIDKNNQLFLADLLTGFFEKNYSKVTLAHEKIGLFQPIDDNARKEFTSAMRAIGEIWLPKKTNDISLARLLPQLFQTLRRFGMTPRTNLLLIQKTIMMAEGLGRMLNPNSNIWQLAEPFITDWLMKNYSPSYQIWQKIKAVISNPTELQNFLFKLNANLNLTSRDLNKILRLLPLLIRYWEKHLKKI